MEKECGEKGGGDTDVNVFAIGIDFGKLICLEVIEYLYIYICVCVCQELGNEWFRVEICFSGLTR